MAVSSWNDNGQKQFVNDPSLYYDTLLSNFLSYLQGTLLILLCWRSAEALYRSDFFPGLGWMLTKSTWIELSPKWPKAYP